MSPGAYFYRLSYGGSPAGEETLEVLERGGGLCILLSADVWLPPPRTRQRWQSDLDERGLPVFFAERVEGREQRVFRVEFLREEGQVVLSQGQESLGLPYVVDYHDPLSLLHAISELDVAVGETVRFHLVGGRAYAERLPDQGELRVFRLRPGLSYIYFRGNLPVRFLQQVGEQVFEARLERVEKRVVKARRRRV